jgi:ribosomal protein S16
VNLERANKWISQGAQPSETVRSLLKKAQKAEGAAA